MKPKQLFCYFLSVWQLVVRCHFGFWPLGRVGFEPILSDLSFFIKLVEFFFYKFAENWSILTVGTLLAKWVIETPEVYPSAREKLDNSDFREEIVSIAGFRKCLVSGHTNPPLPCSHLCESYFWSVKVPKENVVSASEIQNVLCACQICAKGKSFIATLYYCSIIFRLNFCIIFQTLSFDRATF